MAAKGERSSSKSAAAWMRKRGIHRTTGRCGACNSIHTVDSESTRYGHHCSMQRSGSAAYNRIGRHRKHR